MDFWIAPRNVYSHLFCSALIMVLLFPGTVAALDYLNASPVGPQFPDWDGGQTELEFADVNADGHIDLLSIGDHGSPYINTDEHGIMVYFTDGCAGWSLHMEGNFGYGGIAVGDANNDGLLDVGYGMHHNYAGNDFGDQLLEVALGDGSATAWTPWDDGLASNGEDWGMCATDFADFDNDGDLDVASNSFGCCNGVHVYRNNGDGTWTQTWALTGGNSQAQLCCGDVNGDGHADIAAAYEQGTIFLGDGAGNFVPGDAGLTSPSWTGVALGDVDGDGCADLSFTRNGGVCVYLWRTDHWEDSSAGLPVGGSYRITQLWDMNLDGCVDVVALGGGTCSVWLGDGAGGWSNGGGFFAGSASDTEALRTGGDIDHNGFPDLAFVQEEGSWPSYRNYLYVYREATAPSTRLAALQFPRGNETFYIGSVQTIRWSAAQVGGDPATIDLAISINGAGGPWNPIAVGVADGGHYQCIVPGPVSFQACVRITLHQGGESVSAISQPFRMVSGDPARIAREPAGVADRQAWLHISPNPIRERAEFRMTYASSDDPGNKATGLLAIYEASGRLVRCLSLKTAATAWDCRDRYGHCVPPGIYLARLNTGTAPAHTQRLVLVR